jgi:hypothetical protein
LKKKLLYLFCALWILLVVSQIIIEVLRRVHNLVLIHEELYIYGLYAIILLSIIIVLIADLKKECLLLRILVISLIIVIFLFMTFKNSFDHFLVSPTAQYYFSSPKGTNYLLLEETSTITSCDIMGFKVKYGIFKTGNCFKWAVGFAEPDNPIAKGNYKVSWINENEVVVSVFSDGQNKEFKMEY